MREPQPPLFRLTHSFQLRDARVDAGIDDASRFYRAGNLVEAEAGCREILQRQPADFDALHLLGVISLDRRQHDEAVALLTQAVALRPDVARARYHLGCVYLQQKRFALAEAELRQAHAGDPEDSGTLNNLGSALAGLQRDQEAVACFERILASEPAHAQAQFNLARALAAQGRHHEAIERFRQVLALPGVNGDRTRMADLHSQIGHCLLALGQFDEARAACHAAARYDEKIAVWNESLIDLLLGDYAAGWRRYEARWGIGDHDAPRADARVPELAELAGRHILLISEQGRGDIVQFSRYAPMLAAHGARVTLSTYRELQPLLCTLDGVEAVIRPDEPEPVCDIVTPLLSLPLVFGTTLTTVPSSVPYLHAPTDRAVLWQSRLGPRVAPRIGLAWSGAAEHNNDRARSIALARLVPLLQLEKFEFHAVQKDIRSSDQAALAAHPRLRQHGAALHDFADGAALINAMDLVITVDTAAAHVAGALGRPVWLMLSHNPDWRWLLERPDSPWYPTARLFRQPKPGDWDSVIADIVQVLSSSFQQKLESDACGIVAAH